MTVYRDSIHVLLSGGDKPHVGSVSAVCFSERGESVLSHIIFPGHKDYVISDQYAETISSCSGLPVMVTCGIHYDDISREDIRQIQMMTDQMLQELINNRKKSEGGSVYWRNIFKIE